MTSSMLSSHRRKSEFRDEKAHDILSEDTLCNAQDILFLSSHLLSIFLQINSVKIIAGLKLNFFLDRGGGNLVLIHEKF